MTVLIQYKLKTIIMTLKFISSVVINKNINLCSKKVLIVATNSFIWDWLLIKI